MSVCLHCGEIASEGALFCGKCGYTLPQEGVKPIPSTAPPAAPAAARPPAQGFVPTPPYTPSRTVPPSPATGPYAVPGPALPGSVPPMAPPPNAKYCVRCATLIARAAVYCPVCQQPQP